MDCVEAKQRAVENAREPIRNKVYELINQKITENTNILKCDFLIKYYLPSDVTWSSSTVQTRKTKNGEEQMVTDVILKCESIEWLVDELKSKKYVVELKEEPGLVYGKSAFLEIVG